MSPGAVSSVLDLALLLAWGLLDLRKGGDPACSCWLLTDGLKTGQDKWQQLGIRGRSAPFPKP